MAVKVDYRDSDGFMRRVLLPDEKAEKSEGIPLSLNVGQLYDHCPTGFVVRLTDGLFSRGLVEPEDFFKPGAHELCQAAVLDAVRFDALSIISLARSMRE